MTTATFVQGEGVELAVHDFGGSGDTILVAHATGFLGRVYRAFAAELTAGFHVVALDFRAHGDSSTPARPEGFDWSLMASDVAAVVDHLRTDVLHGVGHSMGGAAILEAERLRPGSFASAWLFEPIVTPSAGPSTGESSLVVGARSRRPGFASAEEALSRYSSRPPLGLFRADVLHDYVMHGFHTAEDGSVTLKCTPDSEATTFAMTGAIHHGNMGEMLLPTIVAESGDGGLPAQLAPPLADALPNGRLERFEHLTHFGPLQEPVSVAAAVREHIGSLSRSIP